ncbi:hypothetical protein V1520DRAFT_315912 [Lipomyces starkeyi]|uniref:Ketoreductase (KR) domain-containing protein n=1 Tax=Lipomyces starkeyi NRRL Y-11557 TaxID=675824 RepID=A0A1E3QGK5_LIPST|nr:hypothetical protein LIPSTDRAFT_115184 [Lipomyces starkeyi NRRL Y-11557]
MASPKVVLVTGGNDEIGYGAVKVFLESDKAYHVLLGSLSLEKGKAAIKKPGKESPGVTNTVEVVQKAFEKVKASPGRLDAPNNAGATFDIEYVAGKISLRDCFNKASNVNISGTNSADPLLIFVAGLSQISVVNVKYFPTPPLPAGWPKKVDFETIGYRSSKTALNMVMLDWNHKLKEAGVKVWGVGHEFLATTEKHSRQCIGHWGVVEGERDADVGTIVGKFNDGKSRLIPF